MAKTMFDPEDDGTQDSGFSGSTHDYDLLGDSWEDVWEPDSAPSGSADPDGVDIEGRAIYEAEIPLLCDHEGPFDPDHPDVPHSGIQGSFADCPDPFVATVAPTVPQCVEKAAQWLAAQQGVDSVRLFVTFGDGDATSKWTSGYGNYYSQLGSVQEWILHQQELAKKQIWKNSPD